jgi:hypothetical protein
MANADMNFTRITFLALPGMMLRAQTPSTWEYGRVNVHSLDTGVTTSGLKFTFNEACGSTAQITVDGTNGTKLLHETGQVDVDPIRHPKARRRGLKFEIRV